MLQHYSHIRSHAKQAAIRTLEELAITQNLPEPWAKKWQSDTGTVGEAAAKLLQSNGGPGRIRTYDQRIMSPLL